MKWDILPVRYHCIFKRRWIRILNKFATRSRPANSNAGGISQKKTRSGRRPMLRRVPGDWNEFPSFLKLETAHMKPSYFCFIRFSIGMESIKTGHPRHTSTLLAKYTHFTIVYPFYLMRSMLDSCAAFTSNIILKSG